jgi:hypothetical protein
MNSYIYISTSVEQEKLIKLFTKLLGNSYELDGKNGVYKLTLPAGQKGQALLQTSFRAACEDLGGEVRGLIVPMFLDRFINYIHLVKENTIQYLFEVGYEDHSIYADAQDLISDIDVYTLQTVKAYIEAGNSPSLASLRLYVHRNTVTYRVDRFIQQTGIDLKPFPNAVFIYFLIDDYIKKEENIEG